MSADPPPPYPGSDTHRYSRARYEEAFDLIANAREADESGRAHAATLFYVEGISLFLDIRQHEPDEGKRSLIEEHIAEYIARSEELQASLQPSAPPPDPETEEAAATAAAHDAPDAAAADDVATGPDPLTLRIEESEHLLERALTADEAGSRDEALDLYTDAAEMMFGLMQEMGESHPQHAVIRKRVASVLDRAEALKNPHQYQGGVATTATTTTSRRGERGGTGGGSGYTELEKRVLRATSRINGHLFVPFLAVDLNERFRLSTPFCDPDGLLALSSKQRSRFGGWRRPHEFTPGTPTMISLISAYSVTQTVITDCSFVASLAVAAMYERRFKKQLITSCIYPQNKKGQPVINPSGKYMVRLTLNGVPRKVVVDDRLPTDRHGRLLCSHSNNLNELYVSIVEKAFLKVHGGYDFPGSNSGIDLHMLSGGWIPETIDMHAPEFDKERVWSRLYNASRIGDCVLTVATDDSLGEPRYEELGLVSLHAYAVLDLRQAHGKRFLQVKNPWAHKSWNGPYCAHDTTRWTPALQRALAYDVLTAVHVDNGVFWIDYDSLIACFSRVHVSWNPDVFAHRYILHDVMSNRIGPKNDRYNMGYNPQFCLRVVNKTRRPGTVWILLSRHVVQKEERSEDFITIHVYEGTQGKRVYYPGEAAIKGTYINSPHYLVRFDPPPGKSTYTLVISQYERLNAIYYTLSAYSSCAFRIDKIPLALRFEERRKGKWTAATSGGSCNEETYGFNPQFRLEITAPTRMLFKLECPVDYSCNVMVVRAEERVNVVYTSQMALSSGPYRHGFALADSEAAMEPGVYMVVVSTYEAGQFGPFVLGVGSNDAPFALQPT